VWQNNPPLNGRPLTAQDIVYSLNRQATPGYPNSALLSNISEITAVGEHEILIRLHSPDSEVLEKLADAHSRIVAQAAVEMHGDLRPGPTVGTGPWFASEVHSDVTRLIINPDYYDTDLPYLDGLDIQVIPSGSVRAAGMRTKILDVAQASFEAIDDARTLFDEINWVGIENPAAGVEIMMNSTRSPLDKLAVREALMLTITAGVNPATPGSGIPAEDPSNSTGITLGLPLLMPQWQITPNNFPTRFNDLAKANTLLATAGLEPTDNVIIRVGEFGDEYIDQANAIATGLAAVGIRAEVERVSTRVFGDEVWTTGDYDIAVGTPPPVSSTTAYLFSVHHSNGPWNTTGYADPELDRLIEAQAREYDSTKRGELLLEIQQRILTGSHRFIAQTRTTHWMFWNYVHDFQPNTPRGDTDFLTKVWLTSDS
jgi:ABC-type transport system substrate-binding protein